MAQGTNVHLLENQSRTIGDVLFLGVKPKDGRNESSSLPQVLETVADCLLKTPKDVAEVTTRTAKVSFRIEFRRNAAWPSLRNEEGVQVIEEVSSFATLALVLIELK